MCYFHFPIYQLVFLPWRRPLIGWRDICNLGPPMSYSQILIWDFSLKFFLLFNMFSRKFAVEIKPVDDTKMWPPRDRHVIRLWSWDLPRTWLVKNACDLNILVLPWQLNAKNEILFQDVSDVFLFLKWQSEKGWQINRQSIG